MYRNDRSQNAEAILWVLIGTALFSIVFASGKFAEGIASPLQIVFLRYISGFATLSIITVFMGKELTSLTSKKPFTHFIRAILGCYGGVAIIQASADMPILDATAISLLYVIFIIALGVIFLREQIGKLHWAAIVLSSLGALIVMISRGAFQNFNVAYLWPASIAVGGAFLIAIEAILIRTLSQSDKAMTVLLYVNFFGILLIAIPAYATWQSTDISENLPFLLLGPVAISAQYCIIRGYRIANVSVVGPIDYSWLVFAGFIGFLFFDETPTLGVIAGAILIALGGFFLTTLKSE